MDSILASHPAAPGSIFGALKILPRGFSSKTESMLQRFIYSALLRVRVNSEKSLIVDRTHLELVSGKLVLLQKNNG